MKLSILLEKNKKTRNPHIILYINNYLIELVDAC
jgi:hypothetical protein